MMPAQRAEPEGAAGITPARSGELERAVVPRASKVESLIDESITKQLYGCNRIKTLEQTAARRATCCEGARNDYE